MSEYGFGYVDPDMTPGAGEQPETQGPKWFREYMGKVSEQLKDLKAENDTLRADRQRAEVENALTKQGYAPGAAGLYTGEPAKLGDWLKAHGDALAKLPPAPEEGAQEGQQQTAGPPVSTVPAEDQQAMQRMQEAGRQGAAPPQGTDAEQAAAFRGANSPEALSALLKAQGNPYV